MQWYRTSTSLQDILSPEELKLFRKEEKGRTWGGEEGVIHWRVAIFVAMRRILEHKDRGGISVQLGLANVDEMRDAWDFLLAWLDDRFTRDNVERFNVKFETPVPFVKLSFGNDSSLRISLAEQVVTATTHDNVILLDGTVLGPNWAVYLHDITAFGVECIMWLHQDQKAVARFLQLSDAVNSM